MVFLKTFNTCSLFCLNDVRAENTHTRVFSFQWALRISVAAKTLPPTEDSGRRNEVRFLCGVIEQRKEGNWEKMRCGMGKVVPCDERVWPPKPIPLIGERGYEAVINNCKHHLRNRYCVRADQHCSECWVLSAEDALYEFISSSDNPLT